MFTVLTSDLQTHVCTHAHAYMCTLNALVSDAFRVQGTEVNISAGPPGVPTGWTIGESDGSFWALDSIPK